MQQPISSQHGNDAQGNKTHAAVAVVVLAVVVVAVVAVVAAVVVVAAMVPMGRPIMNSKTPCTAIVQQFHDGGFTDKEPSTKQTRNKHG